jgi:hypothetical protein
MGCPQAGQSGDAFGDGSNQGWPASLKTAAQLRHSKNGLPLFTGKRGMKKRDK